MLLASAAGDGAARHLERASLLLDQAVTGSLPRPVPHFNRAVLASQSGDPLPAGHLEELDELATGTVAADASPLELIIPPETLDVAGFFWRKARLWVEWAQLIERYPAGGPELAAGFAPLAAARAWGLHSDALRARGARWSWRPVTRTQPCVTGSWRWRPPIGRPPYRRCRRRSNIARSACALACCTARLWMRTDAPRSWSG